LLVKCLILNCITRIVDRVKDILKFQDIVLGFCGIRIGSTKALQLQSDVGFGIDRISAVRLALNHQHVPDI
jgi:hypothetical protein